MPSQYKVLWSTPGGGAGFSVLNAVLTTTGGEEQGFADVTQDFFTAIAGVFPDDVTLNFDAEVTNYSASGVLGTITPVTPPTAVVGTSSSTFNRAAGCRIDWLTGQVVGGRRLNGRTYLVPAGSANFDTTGLVNTTTVGIIETAGNDYISDMTAYGNLVVWSRKYDATATVTGCAAPSKGAILTGRRD